MSAPMGSGWWTSARRRLLGALAASCCVHLLVIGIWFSILAQLPSGAPLPALRGALDGTAARSAEMIVTSIEFRPKPASVSPIHSVPVHAPPRAVVAHAHRRLSLPRTVHHQRKTLAVTVAPAPAPVPPPRPRRARRAPSELPAAATLAAAPVTSPLVAATAAATFAPSPQPTAAPRVAEIGLWGLDSNPVLLDRVAALLGDIRRHLHIEIEVDAGGHATRVRVDDAGGDAGLVQRVTQALLTAHYAAARCNNLPCDGQLVLLYP